MNTINRFLTNTVNACIPRKEYSVQAVINKLEIEIYLLHEWLLNNEPGTDTWREKRKALLRKIDNLNEIKSENQLT